MTSWVCRVSESSKRPVSGISKCPVAEVFYKISRACAHQEWLDVMELAGAAPMVAQISDAKLRLVRRSPWPHRIWLGAPDGAACARFLCSQYTCHY